MKKNVSKKIALFVSLVLILSFAFFSSNLALALTWSTPEQVATNAGYFDMKLDSQGNNHVVYMLPDGEGSCYYRNNTSGSWSAPENVSGDVELCEAPALAIDNNDKVHIVFVERIEVEEDPDEYYVHYTTDLSGTWSASENLGETELDGDMVFTAPNIITDSLNNPHVLYQGTEEVGELLEILYTTKSGTTWSDRDDITGGNGGGMFIYSPRIALAIDSNDTLHASYFYFTMVPNPSMNVFYVKKVSTDSSWSAQEQVSETITMPETVVYQFPSSIVIDTDGTVYISYSLMGLERIRYLETGTSSETINSTTNTQIAQAFETSEIMNSIWDVEIYQSSGGNLVGNVKIVTDDAGQPSDNVIGQEAGVTLFEGDYTEIDFDSPVPVSPDTTYWLVFEATSGEGTFEGGTTGEADQVMYYDGSWNLSENIENMYFEINVAKYDIYYASKPNSSWQRESITDDSNVYLASSMILSHTKIHVMYKELVFDGGEPSSVNINYVSKDKTGDIWSSSETIVNVSGPESEGIFISPLAFMYNSLHLGYLSSNNAIYYTQSDFQDDPPDEDPANGDQQPTTPGDQDEATTAKKLTELPETGQNPNLLLLLLSLSTITPHLIEKVKGRKKN